MNNDWHYCEACGFDDKLSKLNDHICCWHMHEELELRVHMGEIDKCYCADCTKKNNN